MDLVPTARAIIRHLECPICYELCVGKRFHTCISGHAFCEECYGGFVVCPLCRGEFLGGRAFGLESLANDVILHCRYQRSGCNLILKGNAWRGHVQECDFRWITCTAVNVNTLSVCGYQSASHTDFMEHIGEPQHKAAVYKANAGTNAIYVSLHIRHINRLSGAHTSHVICCALVNGDGQQYVLNAKYVDSHKVVLVWISYVGRPSESINKAFKLVIKHAVLKELKVTYKIPIRSAHLAADVVEELGYVAHIPKLLAETYAGANDELLCKVEITDISGLTE